MSQTLANAQENNFDCLQKVVAQLRGEQGCPWDKKQTPQSLKKYLREECEELLEAIDQGREKEIAAEIGDLLFVLSLLIAIYQEEGAFGVEDVLAGIIAKMIRRHPHVFAGQPAPQDEAGLRAQWQRIKSME